MRRGEVRPSEEFFDFQGRRIGFPVAVRRATTWAAQFLVPWDRARELVPARLDLIRIGRRALLSLAIARYEDTDLDAYNELAVAIAVRPHDGSKGFRVYIRHLPVNQEFTLEAGRRIWGFPKTFTNIVIAESTGRVRCTVTDAEEPVVDVTIRTAGLIPLPNRPIPTYSDAEGALQLTSWNMRGRVRAGRAGVQMSLGTGPIADELRSLGLPKRALMATSVRNVRARFGPPTQIS